MVFAALCVKLKKVTALHFFRHPPARSLDAQFFHSFPFPKGEVKVEVVIGGKILEKEEWV